MSNIFGHYFRISTFGESHGEGLGVIIDGCPSGLKISKDYIQKELDRRKPGQSTLTTSRQESDTVQILSGILDGITLGTPIALIFKNDDARPKAYRKLQELFRPSHADFTYQSRYGIRDPRGGGRSSNRETVARVAAGAIAKKLIYDLCKIESLAWVKSIGKVTAKINPAKVSLTAIEKSIARCPDLKATSAMKLEIEKVKKEGDSLGGSIDFRIKNVLAGIGAPVFNKLNSAIGQALLSIGACRSFEIGLGSEASQLKGSEHNDEITLQNGKPKTLSNNAGGILGGISNGEIVYGTVVFKPTATIAKPQLTIDKQFKPITFKAQGRHDPCVLPRAVPIVEAMLNLVLADQLMSYALADLKRLKKIFK